MGVARPAAMRWILITWAVLAVASLLRADADPESSPFRPNRLAEGVYVFQPDGSDRSRANSLVVESGAGLLVVDAQPTPEAARELLAAVSRLFGAPVRFLVYSHAHTDAVGGASAFPESVLRIASTGCEEAISDPDRDIGAEAREHAPDGSAWKAPPRLAPNMVIEARTTLPDEDNPVVLIPIMHAHTRGDLIVHLPEVGVLAVGDVVFTDRNPYARDAKLGGWLSALNHLLRMTPEKYVPLRGPVIGADEVRRMRDSFAWLRGGITLAFVDVVPRAEIADRLLGDPEVVRYFDPEAKPLFFHDLVERGIEEELVMRRKRGMRP